MVLKEFFMHVPQGRVDVSFYIHMDGEVTVKDIRIHADFETEIPHRVLLKQDINGQWKLYADHPVNQAGELKIVPEFLDDPISQLITTKILEVKADYSASTY